MKTVWGRAFPLALAGLLCAATLAACGSSPAPPLARGKVGNASQIPWSQVSGRWALAAWNPVSNESSNAAATATSRLYVVDPAGGRYLVRTFKGLGSVLAWSYSLRRAILSTWSHGTESIQTLDVSSGATLGTWRVGNGGESQVGFADASGDRLIALVGITSGDAVTYELDRLTLSGTVVHRYAHTLSGHGDLSGTFATSATGSVVAAVASNPTSEFAFWTSSGHLIRTIPMGNASYCWIDRFWNATSVLAWCNPTTKSQTGPLYLIDENGTYRQLTPNPPGHGFEVDGDGWEVDHQLYIEESGYCGEFIVKFTPPDTRTVVDVPQMTKGETDQDILGATSTQLLIHGNVECLDGKSIVWYDPAHHKVSVVLGPPLTGGNVSSAVIDPRDS